jgi:four helix bundle protein
LPHAVTAIAAAHKLARTSPSMTRTSGEATRPRLGPRSPLYGKKTQDAGNGEQGTGDGEYRLRIGDNIADGLLSIGTQIVQALRHLPDDAAGRHLGIQLFRSATSPGANYGQARAAESRADFVHKVSIAAKEMREACYWISLLDRSGWVKCDLRPLVDEAERLAAILAASARTARLRGSRSRR